MENEDIQIEQKVVREVSLPLFSSKGWIKFLGILMIIYGVFAALTIVGIIIAWLPIWLGVLLNQTANRIEQAQASGDILAMVRSQNSLSTYFTVYGVLALIGIIGSIIAIIVVIATGVIFQLPELMQENYY
ncbi:MAG: DUF5362 family protein [Bacteroidales bacterium]|jgi:hypothetical protein|nr:DUF5362 family protein [Bacteroidales bacterium]